MKRIALVIASLTLSGGLALAQTPEKVAEHWFNQGNTAYNLGRFDDAVGHFTKAYEAWPQPEFLYNIAQSYRLAGNCKQALHFYKRFKSLKERDEKAPLSAKKREEVDRFIKELTDCAAKADTTATAQPDTIDAPPRSTGTGATGTTTGTTGTTASPPTTTGPTVTTPTAGTSAVGTTTGPATTGPTVGALESPDEDGEVDAASVRASTTAGSPTLVSARMTAGIALLGSGDLDMPVLPSFGITGGYPLPVGPLTLELGAGLSYTPLPYEAAGMQERGTMLGVRAVVAAVYPVTSAISLRGDIGVGIVSLSGLDDGNPLSSMRQAQSFTLPSFRFGVAADYAISPNLVAYVSPFGFAFSPGNDDLYGGNLRQIDILFGVGYRQ